MLDGVVGIYYRECTVLRKKIVRILLAAAVPPFAGALGIGLGIGRGHPGAGFFAPLSQLLLYLPGSFRVLGCQVVLFSDIVG